MSALAVPFDAGTVLATTGSGGDGSGIGLIFFLSGFVFYGAMYLRYRNADKRYRHEKRTRKVAANFEVRDDYVRSLKGLRHSSMRGANNDAVSGSLNPTAGGMQRLMREVNRYRPHR